MVIGREGKWDSQYLLKNINNRNKPPFLSKVNNIERGGLNYKNFNKVKYRKQLKYLEQV